MFTAITYYLIIPLAITFLVAGQVDKKEARKDEKSRIYRED